MFEILNICEAIFGSTDNAQAQVVHEKIHHAQRQNRIGLKVSLKLSLVVMTLFFFFLIPEKQNKIIELRISETEAYPQQPRIMLRRKLDKQKRSQEKNYK